MKKFGFTLAEVLITLGIIGIVAAMTLPSLVTRYKEKQSVTALKKAYTILNQAGQMIYNEYGNPDNWGITSNALDSMNSNIDIFNKFIKTIKTCKYGEQSTCFYSGYYTRLDNDGKTLNGDDFANVGWGFVLPDGQSVKPWITNTARDIGMSRKAYGNIAVDINGSLRPNSHNQDLFFFYFLEGGQVVPYGMQGAAYNSFEDTCITNMDNGCTAWVIFNENMDYLHCKDLSWDGKHKCK